MNSDISIRHMDRTHVAEIAPWSIACENRLRALEALNGNFSVGKETRMNIAYLAMPKDIRATLDNEFAKGNLLAYDGLKSFLTTFSNSEQANSSSGPPPLTIHAVTEAPPAQPAQASGNAVQHADEDWFAYAITPEGHEYCKAHVDDPTVSRILAAMLVKGKGKGNVGPKGNGQWTTGAQKGKSKGNGGKGDAPKMQRTLIPVILLHVEHLDILLENALGEPQPKQSRLK